MNESPILHKDFAEYEQKSDKANQKFVEIIDDVDAWKLVKNEAENHDVKVEARKDDSNGSSITLTTTRLNVSPKRALTLLAAWLPYREQWDELLQSAHVIETISPTIRIIQHLTKKRLPLSARESIDVVTLGKTDHFIYITLTGTTHPDYPVRSKFVRTHQYLGGYAVYPDKNNENQCLLKMIFQADLNLPGPKLVSNVFDMVKPQFMTNKIKTLKKALENGIIIDQTHVDSLAI